MSIASPIQNAKVKGQPTGRRYQRFRDQHDRVWGAVIELKTGDPCDVPQPVGWKAPLMPEPKYVQVKLDSEGHVEVGQLVIRYDQWLQDARRERKDWDERAAFYASALYSEKAGEMLAKPGTTPELRRLMKGAPAAPEPIYAATKGDRWILGLEQGECPEYLRPYFAKTRVTHDTGQGEIEIELEPSFVAAMERAFEAQHAARREAEAAQTPEQRALAERARHDAELEAARTAAALARKGR